jgi:hypothetical protein
LARVHAFQESPEGLARRRIFDLELATFSRGPSTAEQDQLDRLRKLYPDVPLDDDDPMKEAVEAWRKYLGPPCRAARNAQAVTGSERPHGLRPDPLCQRGRPGRIKMPLLNLLRRRYMRCIDTVYAYR